jgi:hypothetical protein
MEFRKPMRLLFLCSSLEAGRDGVGDHVRLLAEACGRQGHACALLALNDPFVEVPVEERLEGTAQPIPVTRLPHGLPWPERIRQARAFRDWFQPDWTSFHLVPYAFQPRGLLQGRTETLREIVGTVPLHLMCHELWLGGGRPTPLRQRLVGIVQRQGVRRLLRRLQPRLVTTTNPIYARMLRALGAEASVLPLFGNIPLTGHRDPSARAAVSEVLARAGVTPENRAGWWIGLFFGALHAEWQPEPFLPLLQDSARAAGKRICLVLAGRAGSAGEATWRRMEATYGPAVTFLKVGELTPAVLSAWLSEADFGVAASPWQLIGKSGTVASMLDHGLPVIVNRDDFQPDLPGDQPPSTDPLIHRLASSLPGKLAAGLSRRAAQHRVDAVAAELCAALAAVVPPTKTSPVAP